MCARFSINSPIDMLRSLFGIDQSLTLQPSYNIAPGTSIPIIKKPSADAAITGYVASIVHWGLIPHWASSSNQGARLINARAETVHEKPSFKKAFQSRRCLIPCSGFYEWKTDSLGEKQPYYIFSKDKPAFTFAGLWETWQADTKTIIESCTILTMPASETISEIHNRMPVTVRPEFFEAWLNGNDRKSLPSKENQEIFESHPVHKKIGNVRNNTADLIEKIDLKNSLFQGSLF